MTQASQVAVQARQRILLLDDSPLVHERVKRAFEGSPYDIVATDYWYDVQRAVFSDQPPAALILDLRMPAISGLAVCRAIKRRLPIPILVFSSEGAEALRAAVLETGADAALAKDSSDDALVDAVANLLERNRGAREKS